MRWSDLQPGDSFANKDPVGSVYSVVRRDETHPLVHWVLVLHHGSGSLFWSRANGRPINDGFHVFKAGE